MHSTKLPRGVLEIPKGTALGIFEDKFDFNSKHDQIQYYVKQLENSDDDDNTKLKTKQKLEDAYVFVLINYCKESIMKQVEQDLWNNIFKKSISELQNKMRCKEKIEIAKAQVNYHVFLEYSIGFYQSLLNLMCQKYQINLPYIIVNHYIEHVIKDSDDDGVSDEDLRYLIQYCYVHIGDLFRYQGDFRQASHYYQMAIRVEPYSGHAYNQLAILESAVINKVGTLSIGNFYHYMQTLMFYDYACTCNKPFPATRINLESLMRQITDQSVSELLTSGNKLAPCNNDENTENGLFYIASGWLHIYAESRLRNNIQRCKQLQQRVIEWIYEHFRRNNNRKHWRTFAQLMALQCGLITNNLDQQNTKETQLWIGNIQQFTCDMVNSLSRAILVSSSSSSSHLLETFKYPGCVSFLTIFLTWMHQYVDMDQKESPGHTSNTKTNCPINVPFGEDFIKLLNLLLHESDVLSMEKEDKLSKLPVDLVELHSLRGYAPLKIPYIKYDLYSQPIKSSVCKPLKLIGQSNDRILFILSVSKLIGNKWRDILLYNDKEKKFTAVAIQSPIELIEEKPEPYNAKIIELTTNNANVRSKPVNIALQSLRNNLKDNGVTPSKNVSPTECTSTQNPDPTTSGEIDTKLAKCIQDQITASAPNKNNNDTAAPNSCAVESSPATVPKSTHTPGLIQNFNLPSNYMVNTINEIDNDETSDDAGKHTNNSSNSGGNELFNNNIKLYNPNRENFEKHLPPRFANKRYAHQKEGTKISTNNNSGGFSSMSFWDTIRSIEEPDLSKKESEPLIPPNVPHSWLNELAYATPSNTNNITDKKELLSNEQPTSYPLQFTYNDASNGYSTYQNGSVNQQNINNKEYFLPNNQNVFKPLPVYNEKNQLNQNINNNFNNKYPQQSRNTGFPPPPNFFNTSVSNSMQFNRNQVYNNCHKNVESDYSPYQHNQSQQHVSYNMPMQTSHNNVMHNGNSFGHGNPLLNLLPTFNNTTKDGT